MTRAAAFAQQAGSIQVGDREFNQVTGDLLVRRDDVNGAIDTELR